MFRLFTASYSGAVGQALSSLPLPPSVKLLASCTEAGQGEAVLATLSTGPAAEGWSSWCQASLCEIEDVCGDQ